MTDKPKSFLEQAMDTVPARFGAAMARASHGAEPAKGADAPLLPCPFCGEQPTLVEYEEMDGLPAATIDCRACDQAGTRVHTSAAEVTAAWNRRASPIKAEVTTGEAQPDAAEDQRFAEIVEQARKNVAPIVAREAALLVHSTDCAVHLPVCRPCSCCLETKMRDLIESLARERDALRLNHPAEGTVRCTCNSYPHTPNCGLDERLVILRHSLADALKRIDDICADAQAELKEEHAANASLRAKLDERDRQIAVYTSGGFSDADALAIAYADQADKLIATERTLDTLEHLAWHVLESSGDDGREITVERKDFEALSKLLPEDHPVARQSAQPSNPET